MRTLLLIAAILAAVPDGALTRFGFSDASVGNTLFLDLVAGNLDPPWAGPQAHQLSSSARVAAVKALGAFAKAYSETDDFKKRYAQYRKQQLGNAPAPLQTADQIIRERRASAEAGFAQSEQLAKDLEPAQKTQLETQIAQMRAALEKSLADRDAVGRLEQARFADASAAYQRRQQQFPEDPKLAIRAELQRFLDATADVNFSARLVERGGKEYFADANDESKPAAWKQAFRAGRAPVQAARAFAQKWLGELK